MLLELKQVSVSYKQSNPILDHVSLEIRSGEFIGITGKAGCGKTTLIETIGGLHEPDRGEILLNGEDIYDDHYDRLSFRRKLQIVFQFPENQFFETDVHNELAFGLKMLKTSEDEIEQRISETMDAVGLSQSLLSVSPFALSGGQKRKLALGCALVIHPEILLLDEPFSGLDAEGEKQILSTLQKEHEKGTTILMVSHDPNTLCEISDRIVAIQNGKIILNDAPALVFAERDICEYAGIGQPDTKKTADRIGLDLRENLTYNAFLEKLTESMKKRQDD